MKLGYLETENEVIFTSQNKKSFTSLKLLCPK